MGAATRRHGGLILLTALLMALSCENKPPANPHQVAAELVRALETGDTASLDTIIDWNRLVLTSYYITRDYYEAQTERARDRIIGEYKDKFYSDYLPITGRGRFKVQNVFIMRAMSDAYIKYFSPDHDNAGVEFIASMNLDQEENRWYVFNLGEFFSAVLLQGDFDPGRFYLPEPIEPDDDNP